MHVYLVKKNNFAGNEQIGMFTRIKAAKEFAGGTAEGAFIWYQECGYGSAGWLLLKWKGFEIDYSPVISIFKLPDGTHTGFIHNQRKEPWTLIDRAVWRSNQRIPKWLEGRVKY